VRVRFFSTLPQQGSSDIILIGGIGGEEGGECLEDVFKGAFA
jgi:hypothetical protein